jgi:hypothetical protein
MTPKTYAQLLEVCQQLDAVRRLTHDLYVNAELPLDRSTVRTLLQALCTINDCTQQAWDVATELQEQAQKSEQPPCTSK